MRFDELMTVFLGIFIILTLIGSVSAASYVAQSQGYTVADLIRDVFILGLIIAGIWYFVFRKKKTDESNEKKKE